MSVILLLTLSFILIDSTGILICKHYIILLLLSIVILVTPSCITIYTYLMQDNTQTQYY